MLAMLVFVALVAPSPALASEPCPAFRDEPSRATKRPLNARDLATIADIGRPDAHDSASPFGVSPDGQRIAFILRRANPDSNSYCQRLMVAPLAGHGEPREVDRGGELIRKLMSLRKFAAVRSGVAQVITPRWSPDGDRIAYLKRVEGDTQIWIVAARGGPAKRATNIAFEIEDFAWADDGTGFIIAGRPQLAAEQAAIRKEALTGYLFDDRFSPMIADHPLVRGALPMQYYHVGEGDGAIRPARPREVTLLDPSLEPGRPERAAIYALSAQGGRAWTEARNPKRLFSPARLRIAWPGGARDTCESAICSNIRRLFWSPTDDTVFFLTREGWAKSDTALYRWRSGRDAPEKILTTADALIGCEFRPGEMICAREGARRPRRLVAIDLQNGRERMIIDANPQLAAHPLGEVQRLRYRTEFGVESYADLVLPPDSRPGDKHPLVLVQYDSEGFLRGGTGDEVPIQVLAGRGIAILSFQRPFDAPGTNAATNELEYRQLSRRDWIDRRNVQSAIEKGIEAAIATGRIDAQRLGISGFSEGTSAAQWALINSRLFKVASLGVCCEDRLALPLNGGPDYEQYLREMGYPLFGDDGEGFWARLSLAQNVDRINAPILVQTGEYKIGLDVFEAFRRHGKPIEIFAFENEPHIKWQPAHRLAMYDRVSDWFAFWLQGRRDCDPTKQAQYARWTTMPGAPSSLCDTPFAAHP